MQRLCTAEMRGLYILGSDIIMPMDRICAKTDHVHFLEKLPSTSANEQASMCHCYAAPIPEESLGLINVGRSMAHTASARPSADQTLVGL